VSNADELSTWIATIPPEWIGDCRATVFERARAAYESPPRQYHNWRHVEACVAQISSFTCEHPRTIFLALVFHDAIYIAGRSDNETRSAEVARSVLEADNSVSPADLGVIEAMINATSNHLAHANTTDRDLAVMLDIDLAILGASHSDYARYAQAIHDEYVPSATTDARFRVGRMQFLERALASPTLFITPEAAERWDAGARENVAWEMEQLRADR